MQLDPIHQHHLSLLPPPLFVTKHPHKITKLDLTMIKKWLIEYLAVKEVNADNKTQEAAAITAATE